MTGLLSSTVTLMLVAAPPSLIVVPTVQGFQMQSVHGLNVMEPPPFRTTATRRFFRDTEDASSITNGGATTDAAAFVNPLFVPSSSNYLDSIAFETPGQHQQQSQRQQQQSFEPQSSYESTYEPAQAFYETPPLPTPTPLPSWLSESKDSSWESNWHTLEEAMLESFFTPQETQRLLTTIEIAAEGDRHKMATAADFLHLLVETMEMGLTALMAAAHHICACVTARQTVHDQQYYQQQNEQQQTQVSWDQAFAAASQTASADHHSDHVSLIAKDAGRLKTLEMVAAMIYSDKASSRVTPDAEDAQNLRSLLLTETKDWRALAIRSAAALFRLRGILKNQSTNNNTNTKLTQEATQCSREALYIYAPLASRLGMHRLKNELEGAAFRILYRRQSNRVHQLARELRPRHSKPHLNRGLVEMCDHSLDISSCMKSVLDSVQTDMTTLLQHDAHFAEHVQDFTVTARMKEPYSLWKKMLRNKCQHVMEVPDAIALRIVLDAKAIPGEDVAVHRARERALCYYAQSLCLEQWQPAEHDGCAKDYIESPKRNGYQSLHYTAHTMWDNEDFQFEIQVRTGEMHQVAEFGLASHWDYKAQQKMNRVADPPPHYDQQQQHQQQASPEVTISTDAYTDDAYVRSVQEWHWQHHAGTTMDAHQWMADAPDASYDVEEQQQYEPPVTEEEWHASSTDSYEATERADRIRARTQKLQPYIEALTAAQSDLAREHVFVFLTSEDDSNRSNTNSGRVLSLPAGACVLDALREGERELGIAFPEHHRLNGEISTKVTSKLQNGDILAVPLQRTPTPMA